MKPRTRAVIDGFVSGVMIMTLLTACSTLIGFLMFFCAKQVHMTPVHQKIMGVAMGGLFFIRELFLVVLNPKYKYVKRGE
jgi:hypothetical protein